MTVASNQQATHIVIGCITHVCTNTDLCMITSSLSPPPPIRAPVRCNGYEAFCMVDNKPLLRQQTDLIRFRQNLNLSLQVGLRKYSSFFKRPYKIVFSAKRATDYTVEIITHLLLARHQKIGRRRELDVTLKSS